MRAIISVSDKWGVEDFAKGLEALGFEIVSTGGTLKALTDAGVRVTAISDVTGFPECLDGRVKTLHPKVHGGILARRDEPSHMEKLAELEISPVDLICINLYPFKETIRKENVSLDEAIENIDIGGPSMLRAAAKNYKDVIAVTDPADYEEVISELKSGSVSEELKYRLALKVFELTAAYDAMIADYLREQKNLALPVNPTFTYEKIMDLRYGENPHQKAAYYKEITAGGFALVSAKQLHGKELSFNNINDTNGALLALREFAEPAVVCVKHANPCGVGVGGDIYEAYMKAYASDKVSIFGGIVAANGEIDEKTAEELSKIFLEIIIAPSFSETALKILTAKENLRLLTLPFSQEGSRNNFDMKKIDGGLLIQNGDTKLFDELKTVTKKQPSEREMEEMAFGMKVVKHVKSNGIVLVKDGGTVGIGPGQTNRIGALEIAVKMSGDRSKGAVLASDAFFPFSDCVELAAEHGISAIIQPGGSIRDKESIEAADKYDIAMAFSGDRHFKH